MAAAVVQEMRLALPSQPALTRQHVWAMTPPSPEAAGCTVHLQIWQMACLAATTAMETGRKFLHVLAMERRHRAAQGMGDIRDFIPGATTPLQRAVQSARRQFWANITNFASKGVHGSGMKAWARGIAADHPIVGVVNRVQFVVNAPNGADARVDVGAFSDTEEDAAAGAAMAAHVDEADMPEE